MQKAFFFHIPKCAGMSVWHALWDIYGFENVFQVGIKAQREEFEAMTTAQRSSYGAIGGHGFLSRLTDAAGDLSGYYKFVTFRNPVDRIVSEYHFIRGLPEHFKYEIVSKIPLEEFAKQGDVMNMQTRLMCDEADPEMALAELDRFFDDWCLMEDLDNLIARLYARVGTEPRPARHENKGNGAGRKTEDSAVIKEIERLNGADMEFYKSLRQRVEAGLRAANVA